MPLQFPLKSSSRTCLGIFLALSGLVSVTSVARAADVAPAELTAAQRAQIGKIAEDYLIAHPDKMGEVMATYLGGNPEFLVAAGESLHQRQQASQQQILQQMALTSQAALLDKLSPSVGPEDAKVAVVMFFDYQCSYCNKMAPAVDALVKGNQDVRFIFKELPIFASRWPVSALAARAGEQIWQTKGGEAYLAYHNALFETGHMEGQMTELDVQKAAAPYLSEKDFTTMKQSSEAGPASDAIRKNQTLAHQMNFTGTPAFVVLPQAHRPDMKRISVIPGSISQDILQAAIQKAKI